MATETAELQAGSRLDSRVAIKVMGWHLTAERPAPQSGMVSMLSGSGDSPPIGFRNPTFGACAAGYNSDLTKRVIESYWTDGSPGTWSDSQFASLPKLCAKSDWSPSTDIAAAWQMEESLYGRALHHAYSVCLASALWARPWAGWQDWRDSWAIIHATPLDRCRAALQVVATTTPR